MSELFDRTLIEQLNDLKRRVAQLEAQEAVKLDASTGTPYFSAMTQGSVLFAGASGLLSQDNSNLYWDDTNNRLGIGTNAPSVALDVTGNIRATGSLAGLRFDDRTGSELWQWYGTSSIARLFTGSVDAITITNTGVITAGAYGTSGVFNTNGGEYRYNSTKVVGARVTGWNAPSGTLLRGTFNSGTATTTQTAQTLAALITDLRTHGLIGT